MSNLRFPEFPSPDDQLAQRLNRDLADNRACVAVIALEACNLRRIDARYGRRHHDELLAQVFGQIGKSLRSRDWVTRIGDQTFAVVVVGLRNIGHATLAAKKLLRAIEPETQNGERDDSRLEPRIGMALFPEHGTDTGILLQRAKMALELAKESDRDLVPYDSEHISELTVSWDLHDELAGAIRDSELDVYYQPKIDIPAGAVCGAEALVRWFSEKRGTDIPPDQFLVMAESSELIQPLTRFVLNNAMRDLMSWRRAGHDIGVAVNLPASMLLDQSLIEMTDTLMSIWDMEPGRLTLEVTESAIMTDVDACFATMYGLKELGARIAIDDFGTGYSSLSYFKTIPADELKIDRSFVAGMTSDVADQHIVEAIISLAHRFRLQVVAEGIEDRATLAMLKNAGCDIGQGFLFGRPVPRQECHAWLQTRR